MRAVDPAMTRLFVLLYIGVLAVLFAAWYIHGQVTRRRIAAERSRVFEEAHGGGARLVARELDEAKPEDRERVSWKLAERFKYPIGLISVEELPSSVQRRLANGTDIAHYLPEDGPDYVVAALSSDDEVVRLGPFPNHRIQSIEEAIAGWMLLAANRLRSTGMEDRPGVLADLRKQFECPIDVVTLDAVPIKQRSRLNEKSSVVFFSVAEKPPNGDDRGFAAASMLENDEVFLCGPFPVFEQIEQKAATTTLALVLLPAALAIALLLRPVALQLRHVEDAAKAIAAGDLSARVSERQASAVKPLAHAFNNMASRTETLVRTQRELLQAVSHELRTPLTRMRFAIDLIETASDDEERKRRLMSLDAATEELDELVGELLTYVRMETTEPNSDLECIRLQMTLDALLPTHQALHPSIRFDVQNQFDKDADFLFADRTGFQRAIGNLLSNAGRFASSQVTVHAEPNGEFVIVDVDDDGCGIPEAERDNVFEPFVRLEDESSGVGLGLALVKRIMIQHRGSVEVHSSSLGGCRIRTKWPKGGNSSG